MNRNAFLKIRVLFTIVVTFLLTSLLVYQFVNEGIPSHHFLANKELPLISNAWGGIVIPVFTWIMLWRIDIRIFKAADDITFPTSVLMSFFGSLLFGVVLGVSINIGFKEVSSNTHWILFVAAMLFPTYRAEYFLGFVLGLTYWVGGVLPIIVGGVFLVISLIIYKYLRGSISWVWNRIKAEGVIRFLF
jgi:hypothetical protein